MDGKRIKIYNENVRPWFCNLVEWGLMRPVLMLYYEFKAEGMEKVPDDGPSILVCKHQSWMDLFATLTGFPWRVTYLAKYELFDNLFGDYSGTTKEKIGKFISPFTAWGIKSMGALPLDREHPAHFLSTFKTIHKLIKAGEKITLFPEGKVVPGKMGEFKKGFIEMVIKLQKKLKIDIPFVPVGISYLNSDKEKTRIILRAGDPVTYSFKQCSNAAEDLKEKVGQLTEFDEKKV